MEQFSRPQRPLGAATAERPQEEVHTMQHQPMGTAPVAQLKKRSLSLHSVPLTAMLFAVAALIILMLASIIFGNKGGTSITDAIQNDKFQAVFMSSSDGQVYFGKLKSYNAQYYVLSDIYYPKVEQKLQPGQTQDQAQQVISLAKLGNELHGPQDEMFIPKDKVLYWENLKDDGQVVKAITDYKKNPTANNTATTPSTTTPATTPSTTDTTKK